MPSLPQPVLYRKIVAALPATVKVHSPSEETRPAEVSIPSVGRVRLYLWTLTNVAARLGYRSPDEFKIELILPTQVRGKRGELILDQRHLTVLLGFSPDYGVFVAWQAELHQTFGYSSTAYIREDLLQDASGFGWAVGAPRRVKNGVEVPVAFTPGNLLHYLKVEREAHRLRLSDSRREAFFLSRTPNMRLVAPPRDPDEVDTYVSDQRRTLMARRLSRDSRFSPRVRQEYNDSCAVCGIQMEIIEGAHIIPIIEEDGRDEVWNGIALCANHHKLFDAYAFSVDQSLCVALNYPAIEFLTDSKRDAGIQYYLIQYAEQAIRKPRFFEANTSNRGKMLRALERHEKHAAL